MQKLYLLLSLAGAVLLCGCNKQEKINSQKIDVLSEKLNLLEKSQAEQMQVIQAELTSLAPELTRVDNSNFERNREDSLFFHTNTLYLLLTIGKQIEAQLQMADTERQTQNMLAYTYHTNELSTMYLCTAQIEEALADQQKAIVDGVNAETRQTSSALNDDLEKQAQASATAEADEAARRKQLTDEIDQIQRDLVAIKARLGITNGAVVQQ
jgi:hypothetical protein